jgi:hypothetical protein
MKRQSGTTLPEVLIAIFVLAIGLLGILSLFPLGAMRMAQAIKDDRCGTLESNETSLMHTGFKDQMALSAPSQQQSREPIFRNDFNPLPGQQFYYAGYPSGYPFSPMLYPNAPWAPQAGPPAGNTPPISALPPLLTSSPAPPANYNSSLPSYPVYLDLSGWFANSGTAQQYQVGGNQFSMPRRTLLAVEQLRGTAAYNILLNRYTVLLDDLGFGPDGGVVVNPASLANPPTAWGTSAGPAVNFPNNTLVQRDGRYSCALMVRRQQVAIDSQCEMTVVVYGGRSISTPPAETVYQGTNILFNWQQTEVIINYAAMGLPRPKIRKGSWILDATMANLFNNQMVAEPHGFFYRVINVTEGNGALSLELQVPSRATVSNNPFGLLIVMDDVAEVFERKMLTPNIAPGK